MDLSTTSSKQNAESLFDSILIAQPGNFYAIYGKALVFCSEGKLGEGLELLNKAIQLHSIGTSVQVAQLIQNVEEPATVHTTEATSPSIDSTNFEPPTDRKPPNMPFLCTTCGKVFSRHHSLKRHQCLHTGIRPWKCSFCDKGFIQKKDCERHLTVHSDECKFECPQCKKRFKTKKNMSSHRQTHSTERPFKCDVCAKEFKVNRNLKAHERIHQNMPFKCNVCTKKFISERSLKSHSKVHQIERPFVCSSCGFAFKRKHDLNYHFKSQHHASGAGNMTV